MGGGEVLAALEAGEPVGVREAYNALEDSATYRVAERDQRMLVYRHAQEDAAAVVDLGAEMIDYMTGEQVDDRVDTLVAARQEEEPYLSTTVADGNRTVTVSATPPEEMESEDRFTVNSILDIAPGDEDMIRERLAAHPETYEVERRGSRRVYGLESDAGVEMVVETGTVLVKENAGTGSTVAEVPPALFTG